MSRPTRVEVRGLTKSFGDLRAIDGLSFAAEPGAVTGFLGPNGAGKTTTLRILLGLATADAGDATIDGQPYASLDQPSHRVGAALETSGFHPARTGRDHLRVAATVAGLPATRVAEVLDLVGLAGAADRRVGGYSLGMRQRLALAGALLGDPDVLVLDEPSNGLDPEGISWMRGLLRQLADAGRTLLVSSHVLSEVQQLVDEVVIIHRGRLVVQAPLADLADGHLAVAVRSPEAARLSAALARAGLDSEPVEPDGQLRVFGTDPAAVGRVARAEQIELHWLAQEASDLERIFLSLTAAPDAAPAPEAAARLWQEV